MKHVLALVCLLSTLFCGSQGLQAPLGIGDTLQKDLLIEGGPLTKQQLAEKSILLSFWSPNCGSCFHQLEQLEDLQQRFSKKLIVIPVSQSSVEQVKLAYTKVKLKLPTMAMRYSDSLLSALLPYRQVPHYVWVDKDGVIRYITDYRSISEGNLAAFVNQRSLKLPEKRDLLDYDENVPLFQEGGGRFQSSLFSYTYFMEEIPGVSFKSARLVKDAMGKPRGLRIVNATLSQLYAAVVAKGNFREQLKNRPVLFFVTPADSQYLKKKYSYECWGVHREPKKLYEDLSTELEKEFPFNWRLDRRLMRQYTLVKKGPPKGSRRSMVTKVPGPFFRGTIEQFLERLKASLNEEGIFEDQSNYSSELTLPLAAFNHLSDTKAALQQQGFDLQVTTVEKEVIVVKSK